MDMEQYLTNRHRFPPDELARHAGRYVAWSPDGTQIVASDEDPERVVEAVRGRGLDPEEAPISYVPSRDETLVVGPVTGGTES
jgi:hypothetical protein